MKWHRSSTPSMPDASCHQEGRGQCRKLSIYLSSLVSKIRGKNTDSTLHNFLDHGNKHFRSPCFGWNLVGWLWFRSIVFMRKEDMKLMSLPNFAENQVCTLRFRFHRVHTTFFSTRSCKIFQVMISKNNEAGPWGRILIIFGLSLEIQEMDVLFCCCFFL